MRRFFFGMALLAMSSVPVMTVHADENAADQKIAEQIVQRLQTEKQAGRLKGFSIDLQVEEGTVYLSGRVANADQQQAALALARQTPGLRQVVNDLVVPGDEAVDTSIKPVSDETAYEAEGAPEMAQVELSSSRGVRATPVSTPTAAPSRLVQPATPAHPLQQIAAPQQSAGPQQPAGQQFAGQQFPGQQFAGQPGAPQGAAPTGGPVPYARATRASHNHPMEGGFAGPGPVAMPQQGYYGGPPVRYDSPQMPGYSWPSYAAYPNYAGVTYPKQYSASAWPYIGPFYPYPQVPLGWRRVSLEWKDGWWFLDFKDRYRHR